MRHHWISVAALVFAPLAAVCQGVPGTNLTVDIEVVSITIRGDTARIGYRLHSSAESVEQLFQFTVEAPSSVLWISRPEPQDAWKTRTSYRSRSVARWTVLGTEMGPGEVSPELSFEAIGLPAIVGSWVRGYVPPQPLPDTLPVVGGADPLLTNSVFADVVGIEPFPSDVTPANLLSRLAGSLDHACDLDWVGRPPGVCNSLQVKLDAAASSLASGDTTSATGQLQAFVNELDAQRGQHVSENAYWLLKVNVEYVLERLQP